MESALAKTISIDRSAKKIDTTSNGDDFERFRIQRSDSVKFKLEMAVTDSGPQFDGCEGYYAKVEYKALSSFSSYQPPILGAIMSVSISGPEGAQVETITVESGAEGAV
jgi:hypothetical protein